MDSYTKNRNTASENLKSVYFIVLLGAVVLYAATCAPGPLWQDSGIFQYRIVHNDIEGKLGLALSHPLFHIIGIAVKQIPIGELAFRVNLISAIAGAITIANLFLLLRLWLDKITPAAVAALTLALSHTFWRHSVIAESYTLYTALLSAELLMLLQYLRTKRIKFLYLLGLLNGLAIANHMWGIIALCCYTVFLAGLLIKKQIRLRHLGIILLMWIIGAAPYEYLIIKNIIETGSLSGTFASVFFGNAWQGEVLNVSLSARLVKENLILIAYNFPTPNILLFAAGFWGLKKLSQSRTFRNIILALLILFFVFAFRYTVPDRYAFFIPFYFLASILIGVGFNLIAVRLQKPFLLYLIFLLALLPIPTYLAAPHIAEKINFNLSAKRQIPYRNNYTWFLCPWKTSYHGPKLFAEAAFETTEENAAIFADSTTAPPLLYLQDVKKKRTDVDIISTVAAKQSPVNLTERNMKKLLAERPFYVVSPVSGYCPSFLLEQYHFVPEGTIWRVVEKTE
ncbi:protein O-mannosyl-transferase family [Planctomycetota bacterium]